MTTFGQNRKDPQQGKKEFSTHKGFTLIELMVVIAVIAIITSFALPSYRTLIEKRQVTSAAEQLGAFLSSVQTESVKRGQLLFVDYNRTDDKNWCMGVVEVDLTVSPAITSCDCKLANCKIDSQLRVINQDNLNYPDIMKSMDGDGGFVFDPVRGLVFNKHDDLVNYDSAELELLSEEGTYALNVQITATGRVITCSKSSGLKVPGYKVCANDFSSSP